MANIRCEFTSLILKKEVQIDVILPDFTGKKKNGTRYGLPENLQLKTLYLLHGMSDEFSSWVRKTSIERYTWPYELAVIMPSVGRGFYTDMHHGGKYWSFITEELPQMCNLYFPLSTKREDNFIAGASMGGYGALKLAMIYPERFAAAASISGALDVSSYVGRNQNDPELAVEFENIFGPYEKMAGSENDLFYLAQRLVDSGKDRSRLYQGCGTEDFLYRDNVRFRDHLNKLGIDLTYEEGPGEHGWDWWDVMIKRVIQWMFGEGE